MKIVWIEDSQLTPCVGHGISYYAKPSHQPDDLIAVIDGFDWLHFQPDIVELRVRPPDDRFTAEFLDWARSVIEGYIRARVVTSNDTENGRRIFTWVNG